MSLVDTAQLVDTAFDHIPIIDLSVIHSNDGAVHRELARQVRDACMTAGFFYVKGHGIPDEVVNQVMDVGERFFASPLELKEKLAMKHTGNFKGYHPVLASNNDPNGAGDMHEGFEFGWEEMVPRARDERRAHDGAMAGANVWPVEEDAPGFREALLAYYHAAVDLGQKLFPLFALALDLDANFFEDKTKNSAALMKVLHYPPQTGPMDDRVIGIGAHTDWETFTILWQQPDIQALQVLNSDKRWIDAPPIPGTFVVNLGDQLARWTNDVFKSTVHRATNRSGIERYSIPLFFGVDYDVPLAPIASCISPARPSRYPTITAGEYVRSKFEQTYAK